MKTIEYHITKSFDKKTGKMHHTIECNGKTIYNLEFNKPKQDGICDVCGSELYEIEDEPSSPVDYLEAALAGSQINIIPQYHQELNNVAFELHLLNAYSIDNTKKSLSFISKTKALLTKVLSKITSI